ncbi:MAG: RNA polymerase sigma factor [Anaerolineae bacterium]|nr:RNA polymerase sigma factor [Anaerolineae bacterium]
MQNHLNGQQEHKLLEAVKDDPTAFQALYRHYFPRVYAYVAYRVSRVEDIEDIVADTFLKAVEGLNDFEWRGSGSFAAWLFRIARNLVTSFYRKNNKANSDISLEALPELRTGGPSLDDRAAQKDLYLHLRQLIAELPPRQQEVITLKFFGGLRNREIAQALGIRQRTAAAYLSRGLAELYQKTLSQTKQQDYEDSYEKKD